jgi:hypothetical protein
MKQMSRVMQSLLGAVIVAGVMAPGVATAQTERGSVLGKIADTTGAVVPNATVTLVNDATGVMLTTTANSAGEYSFQDLNPGSYTLTATVKGFEKFVRPKMQVDVGGRVEADVALAPGSENTTVTVEGGFQQLSYNSASLGLVVEEKAITDLPLIYGNPFALETLAAGVTLSGVNPNIHVYDSGSATVSVNGSALNALDYKLDGGPDNRIRYSAYTPSTEFISQYKLNTANYDASEGHSSGGFVNTQLKSGTNQVHGSAFVYYQDPKINATPWSLPATTPAAKPTFVREGGGIGGPFLRDKAFWFAGFEHSRQSAPNPASLTVPTVAERSGDFSALYSADTSANASNICTSAGKLVNPTGTPNKYQIYFPNTAVSTAPGTPTNSNYTRSCVPGNIIPTAQISPVAAAYIALYPQPNNTANQAADGENNFYYGANEPDLYHAEVGRVDFAITPRQSLYSHLVWSSRSQPLKNNYFPPYSPTALLYNNRGVVLGYTAVISPTTVFNAVAAYTRFTNSNTAGDTGKVGPTSIGLPSYLQTGLPITADSLPIITSTLYSPVTTATASQAEDDIWLGSVDLSRQIGKHLVRFGAEYRRYITNGLSGSGEQGNYTSTGNLTLPGSLSTLATNAGFSLAELEFGYLTSGSQTQNSDFSVRTQYTAGYIQDDWRVNDRLTVNLGLRYEHETPDIERNGKQIVSFNFGATNSTTAAAAATYASKVAGTNALLPATISPTGGAIFANTNGYGLDPYNAPNLSLLPRIGFAFAATPKTVIRGGYGIFFDSLNSYYLSGGNAGSTTTFLVPQQGFSSTSSVAAPTFTTATGLVFSSTLANPFPGGLTPVTGNSLGTSTALGQNIQFLQPNPHVPYNERYSLGVQRQLGKFVVALDYVGNHGVHQPTGQISQGTNTGGQEYNNYPLSAYSTVNNGYDQAKNTAETTTVTNPFSGLIPSGAANSLSSSKVAVSQLQRPYPEYASINAFGTNGMSIYNSLQAQLQRRFTNGLSATVAYTWSRTLDAITYLNPTDAQPWYGTSANDRPQRLAISSIYLLPFGPGRHYLAHGNRAVGAVVGGWQLQGVYQIQSGAPLTFTRNDLYNGTNPGDSHWKRSDYKNSVGTTPGTASFGRGNWFNTANWVNNGTGTTNPILTCANSTVTFCPNVLPGTYQIRTFGLRFNTLRADNLNQADVGVQRNFQILELGALQFRAEAINMLNHPVYTAPSTDPTVAAFSEIVSQANQPRVYQFSAFFRF